MKHLVVDPREPDVASLHEAAAVLRRGGIVAYPTDTLYGLAADPRSDRSVERLFAAKGRGREAAIPLIAGTSEQAEEAGTFGEMERRLSAAFWPGPLTIVVPASPSVSRLVTSDRGTVAVRVPGHLVARRLATMFGGCITATSANRSGHPAAVTADEAAAALGDAIDLVLDAGPSPGGAPSTIVQVIGGRVSLVRAGAVAWDRVLESVE